ncbi:hypothetical protein BBK36DRAFT_1142987 [Trichoderma citrinoviride]|uniref:Uncharacterized protein n=1 Tax=Trichoderma citrinoviride TaxID=58853 RepID=A0A2T4B4A7_9HYPO|nr:hypothetical protein BBK36DRAFT_1142987 [Trichoderma citrinoviride]PTB64157.1 hypothetical protein BBK36DRAFT_1142987 [Trichoderma citrinoviride]
MIPPKEAAVGGREHDPCHATVEFDPIQSGPMRCYEYKRSQSQSQSQSRLQLQLQPQRARQVGSRRRDSRCSEAEHVLRIWSWNPSVPGLLGEAGAVLWRFGLPGAEMDLHSSARLATKSKASDTYVIEGGRAAEVVTSEESLPAYSTYQVVPALVPGGLKRDE